MWLRSINVTTSEKNKWRPKWTDGSLPCITTQLWICAASSVKGKLKIDMVVFDGFMTGYFENVFISSRRGAFG